MDVIGAARPKHHLTQGVHIPMPKMGFDQLGLMVARLDSSHDACNVRISEIRRLMDLSCDQSHITLREWRCLLDRIALVQSGNAEAPPG
jgi:hypothetical protein